MLDTDVASGLWHEIKEPLSDIPRWFNQKSAPGDYSMRFVPNDEMLEQIMKDAEAVGSKEEMFSDFHYYAPVQAFHSSHTEMSIDAESGYKFTRCEVEDLRKDGMNGSVEVQFSTDAIACRVIGLPFRAVNWQIRIWRVRVV